jgi:hypothetical protein
VITMVPRWAWAFVGAAAATAATTIGLGAQATPASTTVKATVIGCISRQAGAAGGRPRYAITDTRGDSPTVYTLEGDRDQLDFHVGHTVEVSGAVSGADKSPTLKVAALVYVSTSCSSPKK